MEDVFYKIQKFLAEFFLVPSKWLRFPQIIVYFIIPYVLLTISFYFLLSKKIRLFRKGVVVNWVLSVLLAFFAIPIALLFGPYFAIGFGVLVVVILSGRRITGIRLGLAILLALIAYFLATIASAWLPVLFGIE